MTFKQAAFLSLASLAAIIAVPALILGLMSLDESAPHPSDQYLEKMFLAHEADFNKLVEMSNADLHVVRIAPDFTWLDKNAAWPRPESELGFSQERWETYRGLFKKIGLEGSITREDHGEVIYFIFSSKGLVTHGTEKGYAFSKKELTPTADSLDDFARMPKGQSVVFKKLKDYWYLFYESS